MPVGFYHLFQANRHIWVSFMQTLRANLQSMNESGPETSFVSLLDKLTGFKQFFENLSVRRISHLVSG